MRLFQGSECFCVCTWGVSGRSESPELNQDSIQALQTCGLCLLKRLPLMLHEGLGGEVHKRLKKPSVCVSNSSKPPGFNLGVSENRGP